MVPSYNKIRQKLCWTSFSVFPKAGCAFRPDYFSFLLLVSLISAPQRPANVTASALRLDTVARKKVYRIMDNSQIN